MGLTEGHLLNDEGGAWEPIGGWSDKPNLSPHPQPACCQSAFPKGMRFKIKYPRKKYIALLDVFRQAIDDYKEAVETLKNLESIDRESTKVPENYDSVMDRYRQAINKTERQINFVSWMLAEIVGVVDDDSE